MFARVSGEVWWWEMGVWWAGEGVGCGWEMGWVVGGRWTVWWVGDGCVWWVGDGVGGGWEMDSVVGGRWVVWWWEMGCVLGGEM